MPGCSVNSRFEANLPDFKFIMTIGVMLADDRTTLRIGLRSL